MAIINSCCFWKSLRKGCFASALYSLIFFFISSISIAHYLYEERDFLSGKVEKPTTKTFLGASSSNVFFSMLSLGCAILGFLSSIFVFIGLKKDQKEFFVPYILIMSIDISLGILHSTYVVIFGNLKFNPSTGTLFTFDFFCLCLNIYCLVCIVSQYQEYKIGRGSITNHYIINNGVSHYKAPEKSCIILHQSKTSPMNNGHTNFTLIQDSERRNGSSNVGIKSPFQRRKPKNAILLKKQVKFTDDLKCCSDILTTIAAENTQGDDPKILDEDDQLQE